MHEVRQSFLKTMTKCEHKNFSLEILIDRTIAGNMVLDGNDQPAMKMWADNQGFKTMKRCDDCGEQL